MFSLEEKMNNIIKTLEDCLAHTKKNQQLFSGNNYYYILVKIQVYWLTCCIDSVWGSVLCAEVSNDLFIIFLFYWRAIICLIKTKRKFKSKDLVSKGKSEVASQNCVLPEVLAQGLVLKPSADVGSLPIVSVQDSDLWHTRALLFPSYS